MQEDFVLSAPLTLEDLYTRAIFDHGLLRGEVVKVKSAHISDDSDLFDLDFLEPVEVLVENVTLNEDDITDYYEYVGLIDTYYLVRPVNQQAFRAAVVAAKPSLKCAEFHIAWIDGPTYHKDGRKDCNFTTDA